jgi:hypothetical protein
MALRSPGLVPMRSAAALVIVILSGFSAVYHFDGSASGLQAL